MGWRLRLRRIMPTPIDLLYSGVGSYDAGMHYSEWWVKRVLVPWYRFRIAVGVWQIEEGGFYRDGHWTLDNGISERRRGFPHDGREFWRYVFRGL